MIKKQRKECNKMNAISTSTVVTIMEALGWTIAKEFDSENAVDMLLFVKNAAENDNNKEQNKLLENYAKIAQPDGSCSQTDNNNQRKHIPFYVLGSIATLGVASLVIPKISRKIVNSTYKNSIKKRNEKDDDDWGPEIVKKNK